MKRSILLIAGIFVLAFSLQAQEILCNNGIDDDGDGVADCMDTDCSTIPIPTPSFFNTANNGAGGTVPGGSPDLSWQVSTTAIAGPYSPAIVMSSIPGSYYPSPWPDCNWISDNASGSHGGDVTRFYKIDFMLPCNVPCSGNISDSGSFCLVLDFYIDNAVTEFYVNGVPQSAGIGYVAPAFPYSWVGFAPGTGVSVSLCSGWQPGLNSLIVETVSGAPFHGFLAQASTTLPPFHAAGADIVENDTTICINSGTIDLSVNLSTGHWSGTGITNNITGIFDPAIAGAGSHDIFYEDSCSSDSIVITVEAIPDTVVMNPFICPGDQFSFGANTYSSPGIYIINVPTALCDSIYKIRLEWTDSLHPDIFSDTICHFSGAAIQSNYTSSNFTYAWTIDCASPGSSADISPFVTFTDTGACQVQLIVTDSLGCSYPASDMVYISPQPDIYIQGLEICPTKYLFEIHTQDDPASIYWNMGNEQVYTVPDTASFYQDYAPGDYTVYAIFTDDEGCVDSAGIHIHITDSADLTVPNILKRSSAIQNDRFDFQQISYNFNVCYNYVFTVFDRWGLQVFETTNSTDQPDLNCDHCFTGRANDTNELSEGVYYYILRTDQNKIVKNGFIQIFN